MTGKKAACYTGNNSKASQVLELPDPVRAASRGTSEAPVWRSGCGVSGMAKWLDENHKLFGKINVVDFAVLVLLALLIVRAVVPLWSRRPGPARSAQVTLLVRKILPDVASQIRVGDPVNEPKGPAFLGTVVRKDVGSAEIEVATADGRLVPALSARWVDMRLHLNGTARTGKGGALEFDHLPLRSGQTLTIQTGRATFHAVVLRVGLDQP